MNKEIFLKLWFITYPYYYFPSGYPQVSDLFMLIYILLNFNNTIKKIKILNKFILSILLLTIYIFFVQAIYYIIYGDLIYLVYIAFYIYNLILIITLFPKRNILIKILSWKVYFITVMGLFVYYLVIGNEGYYRLILSFNNPNQLSLYVLIMLIIGHILLLNIKGYRKILIALTLLILIYFQLLSLSKAGIIALFIFYISFFIKRSVDSKYFLILTIMITALFSSYLFINFNKIKDNNLVVEKTYNRLVGIGHDNDDSLEGRGYILITSFPEYMVLGAGEGNNKRFEIFHKEIHSLFANILFSFGFIGFILIIFVFYSVWKNNNINFYIYILPVILLSLTHNSIRSRIFWLLIIIVIYLGERKKFKKYV